MSTALYRRYRPETFDEVIGQEHVTEPLKAAIERGRINHAYLFSGPRGCGKTTSARILARCLNCEKGPTPTPCGECPSCRDLANGGPGSLDVVEIDAASHNGVDDARDLRERAIYAPARDRYKVFILDEAHMVTSQGFNALLKIVEEPPPHIKFIFATTEPEKVIGTIRSRTHHYPFRLVPPEALGNYLEELCARENVQVDKGVLPLVVRAGGGSVRDTLSVLDQLIAGSGPNGVDYATAVALLGYTPDSLLSDIVDAFSAGDGAGVYRAIERVIESGQDPRRFVEDLLERMRDLIVIHAAPEAAHAFLPEVPPDRLERLTLQARGFGQAELSRAADILNQGLTEMSGATSPRLQLELICARILLPATTRSRDAVLSRVERMERRIGMSASGSGGAVPQAVPQIPAEAVGPGAGAAGQGAGAPVGGGQSGPGGQGGAPVDGGRGGAPAGAGGGGSAQGAGSVTDSAPDDFDELTAIAAAAESMLNDAPAGDYAPRGGSGPAPGSVPAGNSGPTGNSVPAGNSGPAGNSAPERFASESPAPGAEEARNSSGAGADSRADADHRVSPRPGPNEPSEHGRSEYGPAEHGPTGHGPTERGPADARPTDVRPTDSRPVDSRSADPRQGQPQQSAGQRPQDSQPMHAHPGPQGPGHGQRSDSSESTRQGDAGEQRSSDPRPTSPSADRPSHPDAQCPDPAADESSATSAPAASGAGAGGIGGEIEAIRRAWPSILAAVEKRSRLTRAIIAANAIPQSFADGVVYLGFNNAGSVQGFQQRDHAAKLAMAINDVLGIEARIDIGDVGRIGGNQGGSSGGHDPSGPGQNPTGGNRGPSADFRRPSPQEVAAVVGTREVDKPQVDHEKFWETGDSPQGPWSSDDEEGESPAQPGASENSAEAEDAADSAPAAPSADGSTGSVDSVSDQSDSAPTDPDAGAAPVDTDIAPADSDIVVPDLSDEDFFGPSSTGTGTGAPDGGDSAVGEAASSEVETNAATDSRADESSTAGWTHSAVSGQGTGQGIGASTSADDESGDEPMEYVQPRWEEPVWHDAPQQSGPAAADVDSTSAGSGAVDVGAVVVPPPEDDDLDYLGAYADPDVDFSGQGSAGQSAPSSIPEPAPTGATGTSAAAKPFKSRFAAIAERHGMDTGGAVAQNSRGDGGAPTSGSPGGFAPQRDTAPEPPSSRSMEDEYDPETDLDISDAPQVGVSVIAKVLGGEIIDERDV
ncbi:DNA polymerase III subunit gamma and tau [Brevibacterium sp. 2SA]|uniref:DNA polymerase III subunit gamma and tau n=1 Tax=Brevibacterium sp. 2SA TaxID=2502198 RepID=UPI0010F7ACE0|nr:DNA polymerase III subunit gamma and tau [Brevibacterium sp. 2SA]